MNNLKSYSEMIQIGDYRGRYEYLRCHQEIGYRTFGSLRYLNQRFYTSREWVTDFREKIIARDLGCDMAMQGFEIFKRGIIHHINPITPEDIANNSNSLFDPENVVLVDEITHKAIHYGDANLLRSEFKERAPDDTIPWR